MTKKIKGWGFIVEMSKHGPKSHFVHFTDVLDEQPLNKGDKVEFEVMESSKGTKAVKVARVGWKERSNNEN